MPDNEAKDKPDKIPLTFFETSSGNEPVREWLLDMDQDDRQEIERDLARVQFRFPVGMPLCRPLGSGLWEVRTGLPSNKIARVIFCHHKGNL